MKSKIIRLLLLSILVISLILPSWTSLAAVDCSDYAGRTGGSEEACRSIPAECSAARACCIAGQNTGVCSKSNPSDATAVAKTVVNILMFVVGLLSVVMIIYSGLQFITQGSNPTKVEAAKKTLTASIIGLAVAILSYAIVNFVVGVFK